MACYPGRLLARFDTLSIYHGTSVKRKRHPADGRRQCRHAECHPSIGRKAGIIVGFIDIGKGSAVIYFAQLLHRPIIYLMAAGLAALAGHNWPVWLGFRGGRGIGIIYGMLLLVPQPLLIMSIPAALTIALTRNFILTLAVMFLPLPLLSWLLHVSGEVIIYSMFLLCIAAMTHLMRTRNAVNKESPLPNTKANPCR